MKPSPPRSQATACAHLFAALAVLGLAACEPTYRDGTSASGEPVARAAATPRALPSWNDTPARQAIVAFVEAVTEPGSDGFVPPEERIAVFDNDGTLWSEQPAYFQLLFAMDRVKELAPAHPEWRTTEPFRSVLADDMKGLAAQGMKGVVQVVAATHSGMTTDAFGAVVEAWLRSARHPTTGRPYTEMVYQPMLELLDHLRANGFRTFIVSGGGVDFMRAFAERTYGIPPEQVVGSTGKVAFEMRDGIPVLVKQPGIEFVDDQEGKVIGIGSRIGRRPLIAVGNSDGDVRMLQYTTIPRAPDDTTPRLGVIVHHTDADREWAYDRESPFGRLDQGLDEAQKRGWTLVDMKRDWKVVHPPASAGAGSD